VQSALEEEKLSEARRLLSWHLVSRDTSGLDAAHISAAAIESVAENASDGSIAPLFFFALGGLPFALAYRFLNTADSMLGYHNAALEWLGKFPARLDDMFNWAPARLAGSCIVLASFFARQASGKTAWRILRRDARLTMSPNAGFLMSAMSGALGVELEKIGHYTLGRGLRQCTPDDLTRARRILRIAVGLAALFLTGLDYYVKSR
jgi:adenosylcobinamide-phosphate synthase